MGLKRRPIKLLAVVWQQHHLDGSPLPQLRQPYRTPRLMPIPPRIALSHLGRAPLDSSIGQAMEMRKHGRETGS